MLIRFHIIIIYCVCCRHVKAEKRQTLHNDIQAIDCNLMFILFKIKEIKANYMILSMSELLWWYLLEYKQRFRVLQRTKIGYLVKSSHQQTYNIKKSACLIVSFLPIKRRCSYNLSQCLTIGIKTKSAIVCTILVSLR